MTTIAAGFVDAAIVLAIGLIATAFLRRRSAALRHAVLAIAIGVATVMPAIELLVPQVPLIRWYEPAAVVSTDRPVGTFDAVAGTEGGSEAVAAPNRRINWGTALATIWLAGVIFMSAALATALVRLARIKARSTPVTGRTRALADEVSRQVGVQRAVQLLQSDDPSLLVTCGMFAPCIILPAGASDWMDARIRVVMRHELGHVTRRDAAIHIVSEVLRVVQWFNPLVWIACRRLRQESEQACDDVVLVGGVEATEYATHLLGVARHMTAHRAAWAAPAIAHPSTLERRIVAMLDGPKNRSPLGRRGWLAVAIVALCVSVPLAAATVAPAVRGDAAASAVVAAEEKVDGVRVVDVVAPRETPETPETAPVAAETTTRAPRAREEAAIEQATGAIAGTVLDQSGGTIPGARATLTDMQTGAQMVRVTNPYGRFTFGDLRPAQYELAVSMPGFAPVSSVVTLAAGADVQRTFAMAMGRVSETVVVPCASPSAEVGRWWAQLARSLRASAFADVSAQQPVRVGGDVRVPKKVRHVAPACPPGAPAGDTTVHLAGRIGVDGFMNDLMPVPGETGTAPAALAEAALDAVRQWAFEPVALNGRPVEAGIDVHVVFRR